MCDALHRHTLVPPSFRRQNNPLTNSVPNLELARAWLGNCFHSHAPCHSVQHVEIMPLRLLDVSNISCVKLSLDFQNRKRYVTLSYKWGQGAKFLLKSENLMSSVEGVELTSFPETFLDAVETTSYLGFNYLWIDALCIKQDDPQELDDQVRVMDDIFKGSSLTLFAGASEIAHSGLGLMRDPVLCQPTKVNLTFSLNGWMYNKLFFIQSFQLFATDREDYEVLTLFQRGWVLQEEVLARRGLIFATDGMWWGCICEEAKERDLKCSKIERIRNRCSQFDSFNNLRVWLLGHDPYTESKRWSNTNDRGDILDEWYTMIEKYSKRQLSFDSDVLRAVAGLASAVGKLRGFTYVSGLWAEDMQLGLLWRTFQSSSATGILP
jgi:hypothetical protein